MTAQSQAEHGEENFTPNNARRGTLGEYLW